MKREPRAGGSGELINNISVKYSGDIYYDFLFEAERLLVPVLIHVPPPFQLPPTCSAGPECFES